MSLCLHSCSLPLSTSLSFSKYTRSWALAQRDFEWWSRLYTFLSGLTSPLPRGSVLSLYISFGNSFMLAHFLFQFETNMCTLFILSFHLYNKNETIYKWKRKRGRIGCRPMRLTTEQQIKVDIRKMNSGEEKKRLLTESSGYDVRHSLVTFFIVKLHKCVYRHTG